MNAPAKFDSTMYHLAPIMELIAELNPHDADIRAKSIDPRRSVALLAPAGSGKTTQLIYRLMALLTVVEVPEHILTITFTNKAAGEIVERVTEALAKAATGIEPELAHERPLYLLGKLALERDRLLGWNLQLNPGRLRIMTFDAYCAKLAATMPIMSGFGGGRTAESPELIYRRAILETLGSVNDDTIPDELRTALESVLAFARNQFEVLVPLFSNLLAKRDQWVGEILHVNAEELSSMLQSIVTQEADHAIGVLQANGFGRCWEIFSDAAVVQGYPHFAWAANSPTDNTEEGREFHRLAAAVLLKADGGVRSKVTVRDGFPPKEEPTTRMNAFLSDIKGNADVEAALNSLLILPDAEYPAASAVMIEHLTIIMRYLLANLMVAFDDSAAVDFQEVAQRAIQALGTGDEVGEALLEEDRVYHLLVDEDQDTSPSQYQLLSRLVSDWSEHEDGRSVFMCGDQAQSIYLFRGATVEKFTEMVKRGSFGPKKLDVYHLRVNFRSSPVVVNWNNEVFGELFAGEGNNFVSSVPFRTADGKVTVEAVTTGEEGEAARVVELVQDAFSENPDQSVAILVRGRSHLKAILPALKAADITVTGTDIDPITESAPVSEVISLIRALWHKADRTSWLALMRSAFVGLSWDDCLVVARGGSVVLDALRSESVADALSPEGKVRVDRFLSALDAVEVSTRSDELAWKVRALWMSLGGMASVDHVELGDVKTVFKLLASHTSTGDLTDPQEFFAALNRLYASPKAGSVQIMTIHKSKGLEFDTVIVPSLQKSGGRDDTPLFYWRSMQDGFFLAPNIGHQDEASPESRLFNFIGKIVKKDQRDELDRICYVAFTRAKQNLHVLAYREEGDFEAGGPNTLLGRLKHVLADLTVEVATPASGNVKVGGVPSKARLDCTHAVGAPTNCFRPANANDSVPTEDELHDELREGEGNDFRAKIEGIVYHRMVEMIAKEGLEHWSIDRVGAKAQAVASLMRREGYPIRDVPAGRDRILDLLRTTLQSEKGRWILSKHDEDGQEVQLSGYRNGRWIHRYLDRPFVDGGCYWITDWKTPACPEGCDVDDFVRTVANRYRAKMHEYKAVVIEAGVTLPVRLGLYLPSVDVFVEV
ncbi:hypothetical protein LCGC14_0237060 [marine sediment metagenome]|jgi:ATP-dependent exoDNAse (exonuclease V) beta subunit|uniref:DNA 3'-5' helicase n=1 Tax=marine sediment metagenome TaxID=412755 RepID=A0A0F9UD34_9ZZZZ